MYGDQRGPWRELAGAIILQAVKDYRKAMRGLKKEPSRKKHLKNIRDCETFFRSQWFRELTDLDGEYLLRKLREEGESDDGN